MSFFKKIFRGLNSESKKENLNVNKEEKKLYGVTKYNIQKARIPNYPIKYYQSNVETIPVYNQSKEIGEDYISENIDKVLPKQFGPFKVNELKTLFGDNFEIESMTGGLRDFFIYDENYNFNKSRRKYLTCIGLKLYDALLNSKSIFTNYIHLGDDFYNFGLDRTHYITNIDNDKFYFTNEILYIFRSYLMNEIFSEKLKTITTNFNLEVVDHKVASLYECFNPEGYKAYDGHLLSNKKVVTPSIKVELSHPVNNIKYKHEKYIITSTEETDMRLSKFYKKATNSEICERYTKIKEILDNMNLYDYNRGFNSLDDSTNDRFFYQIPREIINQLLTLVIPGIKMLYGNETANKLTTILDNIDLFNYSQDKRLLLPYTFIALMEQFCNMYSNLRRNSAKEDLYRILVGSSGESNLSRYLELYDDELLILENLTIGFRDKTAECDSIIISKFGIFVIECKNFGLSGSFKLRIDEDGRWSRVYNDGTEEASTRSAFSQNTEHARILQRVIKDKLGHKFDSRFNVNHFIVISNDKVKIENNSNQHILRISSIYDHISKYEPIISDSEFTLLKDAIISSTVKGREYEYIDYLEEYLDLLKSTLSVFDLKGGFKNLVDKYEKVIPDIIQKREDLIRDFCKVEAQLLYIYKNYDKNMISPILNEEEDPFLNGEFDSSVNKLLKDLKCDKDLLEHPESYNDYPTLFPGDTKFLSSKLHSKVLKNYKKHTWNISERFFYPKLSENNSIHWTDNYFAKFDDMLKPSFGFRYNAKHHNYLNPNGIDKSHLNRFPFTGFPEQSGLVLVVLNRFSSYYFKPKHIYKNKEQDLYNLKNIKIGDTINLGESSVSLKIQPIYAKTALVYKTGVVGEYISTEVDFSALFKAGEKYLSEQDWFSMIYNNNVRFRVKSIYSDSFYEYCNIDDFNKYALMYFGCTDLNLENKCDDDFNFNFIPSFAGKVEFYPSSVLGITSITCNIC